MQERRSSLIVTVALVFVTSALSFYAGAAGILPGLSRYVPQLIAPQAAPTAPGIDLTQLQRVQEYIQQQYVEEVPTQKLVEGMLKGMVEATGDKYSAYFPPKQFKAYLEHFESSFSGVGVRVETSPKTGLITVVAPIKGSPGERAGLRAGDAIVGVDGRDVTKMGLDEAVMLIKGKAGTQVRLTIKREGQTDPLEFTITRAVIEVPGMEAKMLDQEGGIGYIRITEFKKQVTGQVSDAIQSLRRQGMNRLILDLRQNPGGLLDEAIGISSLFLPPKHPVVHIVARGEKKETYHSRAKTQWDMPLLVLVDGGSASASEIVAGAVKDTEVGVLLGEKTFGKGSVQSFYDLKDGGGVKLTTAKYLTAGENSIHEKGIEPDIVVARPKEILPNDAGDTQLAAAVRQIKTMK